MPITTQPVILRRMMLFARDHQDQVRMGGDEVRVMLWDAVLDQIVDRWSVWATPG